MSRRITTSFGFEHLILNGNFSVWTCKLSIERFTSAMPIIRGIDISFHSVTSKKGKVTEKMLLKYATTDFTEHLRMQRDIMLFLEEHAIRQVKKRYSWLHESEAPTNEEIDRELSMEDRQLPF